MRHSPRFLLFVTAFGLALSACAQGTPSPRNPGGAAASSGGDLKPITLFVGYIPNVQFAPIYVGIARGYFREAGVALSIEHGFDETEGLTRIATDNLKFGMISGEQVLLARAQGAPVRYVYRWYQKFPVGVVSPADSDLTDPKQLAGKVVGVPGLFGASYVGLQALLHAAGLTEGDLKEVRAIGYDTAPIVCDRQVEASVIYIANEPAQIENRCFPVNVIRIADYANIVSNGLVTNEKTIAEQPELVRGMVAAFDRALADVIADPEAAYTISREFVENLEADDPVQREVLARSIELWKAEKRGTNDPASWQLTMETLLQMGLLKEPLEVEAAYTDAFLPE